MYFICKQRNKTIETIFSYDHSIFMRAIFENNFKWIPFSCKQIDPSINEWILFYSNSMKLKVQFGNKLMMMIAFMTLMSDGTSNKMEWKIFTSLISISWLFFFRKVALILVKKSPYNLAYLKAWQSNG